MEPKESGLQHQGRKNRQDQSEFEAQSYSSSGISHQNSQCVKREKIERLKKKKKRIYNTKSKGNWTYEEDKRFMDFMVQNRKSFEDRELRRSNKIFKRMAKFVRTRCPEQCRSHHQKYQKKYETFDKILQSIRNKKPETFDLVKVEPREDLNLSRSNSLQRPFNPNPAFQNSDKNLIDPSSLVCKEQQKAKPEEPTKVPPSFLKIGEIEGMYSMHISTNKQQHHFQIKISLQIKNIESYQLKAQLSE